MKKFLKAVIIGISNILPAVSSSSMAVIFKMYNDMLELLGHIYSIKTIKKHFGLFIGLIVGLIIGTYAFDFLYDIFPQILTAVFSAILVFNYESVKVKKKNKFFFTLGIIIMFIFFILNGIKKVNLETNLIVYVISGFFASIFFLLPGVSGSLMLVIFNTYDELIKGIKTFFSNFLSGNFGFQSEYFPTIIICGSVICSCILSSRIIKKLLQKYPVECNSLINGLILTSIICLFVEAVYYTNKLGELILIFAILVLSIIFRNKKKD